MKAKIFLTLSVMWGCASRPILHPSGILGEDGQRDVSHCEDEADRSLGKLQSEKGRETVGPEHKRERPTGDISGILKGDVADIAALESLDSDRVKKRIITKCLAQRGHRVIGFD